MRTVTANASAKLSQNTGTEMLVLLEVEWTEGAAYLYSDQTLAGAAPKILTMGGFDTSMMLEGSGDSQEMSIVLDDIDGSIRAIYNSTDIHKRPARVYLLHKGLPTSDKILVFRGQLVTPIEWDESQRSISFNILSELESKQAGFSMEEGDFPNIPEEALGKAWPLVFGQVCHLPAVKVRAPRRGYLQHGTGIHDFTLQSRMCQAVNIQCAPQATGVHSGVHTVGPSLECVNRRFGEICKLKDLYEQQTSYENPTLNIYNGVSFPQGDRITLHVDSASYNGTFDGNTFTVFSRQHPEWATFNHVPCTTINGVSYGEVEGHVQYGGTNNILQGAGGNYDPDDTYHLTDEGAAFFTGNRAWIPDDAVSSFVPNQTEGQAFASCDAALVVTPGMVGGPKESWEKYDAMEESTFWWAPSGSEVYYEGEQETLYIVSLLPGTVDKVAAYRQAPNGFRYLTEVQEDRYTVYETDYDGYQVVEIGMDKALSHYYDPVTHKSEGWADQIYVSFTSSIGPNPCDIIEWLINKYTDLTVDSASFASVKALLTNYPSNFYLLDRPDVLTLINDIAYQSRCAVYVRNKVLYIRYLSYEPSSVRTLSGDDILFGTFKESFSETEGAYTTHNIGWRTGGAAVRDDQTPERKLILKYNVDKYGTVEAGWDYYTHNIYENILKSGTFWLIRKSNSWKMLQFQLPMKHIDLDVGDAVTIDVAQFSSTPVKCVIEAMNVNPDAYTIDITVWTPVRAGENSPYFWAWPSQQNQYQIWPLDGDTHGGGGYNFTVIPPVGHILLGGAHREDQIIISSGDLHPSDLDDTLLTPRCELSDYLNFNEKPPEFVAKEIAQSAARQATEDEMSEGNPNAGGDVKTDIPACGEAWVGCAYKVIVTWHRSDSQGQRFNDTEGQDCGGPCRCVGGCPSCTGPIWTTCHTFGSPSSARTFAQYMAGAYGKAISRYWECEETGVIGVRAVNGKHDAETTNGGANCRPISAIGPDPVGTPTPETGQPTGMTGDEPEYCDYFPYVVQCVDEARAEREAAERAEREEEEN
jgi:hypothetical protein